MGSEKVEGRTKLIQTSESVDGRSLMPTCWVLALGVLLGSGLRGGGPYHFDSNGRNGRPERATHGAVQQTKQHSNAVIPPRRHPDDEAAQPGN